MSTRVQIMSAYFAAIITESGKISACAETSSGRCGPRFGTPRYLPVLPGTFFDSQNKKTIKGLLEEVDEDSIKLELKGITQQIPFSSIIQANLII